MAARWTAPSSEVVSRARITIASLGCLLTLTKVFMAGPPFLIRFRPRVEMIVPLLVASVFLFCLWGFLELAEEVPQGRYRQGDELILRSLRDPANLSRPVGPGWLKDVMRDVSALGSEVVLTFVI